MKNRSGPSFSLAVLLGSLVELSSFGLGPANFVTINSDKRLYPARYQPDLTGIDIRSYFRNERIIRFQVHCLFYGRQCDLVGRWAKRKFFESRSFPAVNKSTKASLCCNSYKTLKYIFEKNKGYSIYINQPLKTEYFTIIKLPTRNLHIR
jgi:hypothetical protein